MPRAVAVCCGAETISDSDPALAKAVGSGGSGSAAAAAPAPVDDIDAQIAALDF